RLVVCRFFGHARHLLSRRRQQTLNFLPLPHGHDSLRPTLPFSRTASAIPAVPCALASPGQTAFTPVSSSFTSACWYRCCLNKKVCATAKRSFNESDRPKSMPLSLGTYKHRVQSVLMCESPPFFQRSRWLSSTRVGIVPRSGKVEGYSTRSVTDS